MVGFWWADRLYEALLVSLVKASLVGIHSCHETLGIVAIIAWAMELLLDMVVM